MKEHLDIKIYGKVQGVSFRISAKNKAIELGIRGWITNLPDGSVYIEAEGENEKLQQLLKWLRQGPPESRVEKIDYQSWDYFHNFDTFEIK